MSSNDPRIEMHRWYAVVYFGDEVIGVVGLDADIGLTLFGSIEEYEASE